MHEIELLNRRLAREQAARKAAEALLESKSLELYSASQQLRCLAQQYQAIFETAAEGIICCDHCGVIVSANRSARHMFQSEALVGSKLDNLFEDASEYHLKIPSATLFPAEQRDEAEAALRPPQSIEIRCRRISGGEFPAEISASRLDVSATSNFTLVVRDLTRKQRLESRLRQSQKMESIGQLAAGIAHEINTPIQFIGDNLRFIQEAFRQIEKVMDEIDVTNMARSPIELANQFSSIKRQAMDADWEFYKTEFPDALEQSLHGIAHVSKIVRAMKEFSSPTSESLSQFDINAAIQNTLSVAANQCRSVGTIETRLDPELPQAMCLGAQMNQVLLNLLTNAIDAVCEVHAEQGGRIEISTSRNADDVVIRIYDNGIGIAPHIRERIFEPFFTTKPVGRGAGQGLAFVYDVVVEKHQGSIQVISPPTGGTEFVIHLPYITSKAARSDHANSAN
ncbi:MAG: ATP-binding protein [Pirellulaceae bacterium]